MNTIHVPKNGGGIKTGKGQFKRGFPSDNSVNDEQNAGKADENREVDDPVVFGISLFFTGMIHPIKHGMAGRETIGVHLPKKAEFLSGELFRGFSKITHAVILEQKMLKEKLMKR